MASKKDKNSIEQNIETYKKYFEEDLSAIEEELKKSKEYSVIIDSEIEKLSGPSLGSNKGVQHYLIEHITNAVDLQTQRQGLRRDRVAIKKAILDYAMKFADEENDVNGNAAELTDLINKLLEKDRIDNSKNEKVIDENLDNEIDNILNEEK